MEKFILNGQEYYIQKLLKDNLLPENFTHFENLSLGIIRDWYQGREIFTLKTSGSTGNPKNISFSRAQIKKSALRTIDTFNLKPEQTTLCCLNTEFVAGFMMLIRAIEGGLQLIIQEPSANPLALIDTDIIINFVAMTPNQVQGCLDENVDKFRQVEKVLIGGAGIHPDQEDALMNVKSNFFHSYAMTETLTHVAIRKIGEMPWGNFYHALEGVTFEQDENSCLVIHDQLLEIEGLKTNDIVELLDNRTFRWIGRTDNVVNSGGVKIQIEQLEYQIRQVLEKRDIHCRFCLLAVSDQRLTSKLVLLMEETKSDFLEEQLLSYFKKELPKFHDPKEIVFVSRLFLTKTGKIDRIKNSSIYL